MWILIGETGLMKVSEKSWHKKVSQVCCQASYLAWGCKKSLGQHVVASGIWISLPMLYLNRIMRRSKSCFQILWPFLEFCWWQMAYMDVCVCHCWKWFLYYFYFLLIRILLRLAPTQVAFFGRFCGCDGGVGSHDCGCGSHHTPPTLLPSSHMHSWPINSQSTFCSLPITSALAGTLAHAFGNSMLLIWWYLDKPRWLWLVMMSQRAPQSQGQVPLLWSRSGVSWLTRPV